MNKDVYISLKMPFLKPYKVPRSKILQETTKKNGLRHAVFSINGDKYVGEWKNNLRHGKGTYLSKNRRLYEGDWLNGLKHGYGVLSQLMEDGTYILLYEGDWVMGKPEGVGRKHYPREEYYEGQMKTGKRHGHGRMWYADGSFYNGFWANDMKDGLGLYVASNGNRYEGHWRADRKHGYGEYYHLDTGQMQFGLWNQGIAVCTNMRDILFRQASQHPTPYPIPEVGLREPELVYKAEFMHIATQQVEPGPEAREAATSPGPSLSPWFYVD